MPESAASDAEPARSPAEPAATWPDRFPGIGWVAGGVVVGLVLATMVVSWIFPVVPALVAGLLHGPGDRGADPATPPAVAAGYHANPPEVERPDGPPPIPDADLDQAALAALIRLPASEPVTANTCEPGDLELSLGGLDRAAGHRYALLIATNVSDRTCTLEGWPGLGLRGAWGSTFVGSAGRSHDPPKRVDDLQGDPPEGPLLLAPDSSVRAEFEWTGGLAGAHQESASLLAVQLATDGPAVRYLIRPDEHVDLGADSTVRIGQWRFWQGSSGPLAARS